MIEITLTTGELLWLWRKRGRLTVAKAAKALDVTHALYLQAEAGKELLRPTPTPSGPTGAELLRILRRRSKKNRDELCAELGVSHVKWLKMERTSDPILVAYWAARIGSS